MPGPIYSTLSLEKPTLQPASRIKPQSSDWGYLAAFGAVGAVIIGVFFGVGFSLLVPKQIIVGSGTENRGPGVKLQAQSVSSDLPPSPAVAFRPSLALANGPVVREDLISENANAAGGSVSAASEVVISTAAGAGSSSGASAVRSMANAATLARPATLSPGEQTSNPPAATIPAIPTIAAEIAELLARGDSFVVVGDIASARVFYERAAGAGDGRAALRMGTTFDPAFLRRAGLPHTFGDPAQARSWYRRAFDLDDDKVKRRRNAVDTR